ncbi:carbohydrate ABC transporter permease [Paenibacillus sp. HN-1]|uniref:carbohydrate ABC transporter permease n=1 Tax=Paenibacillus TaxID=44249 RepID=UPI001CA7C1BF|nr:MULTISPECIES: carbohydrate ABC transporter permease [Paenibacillus]MBY9078205.1 carbohydrate ABC transporter permease [Paenibacillus sp. CGMCC 1.18879]MBY9086136.1 carbohydrate ABC transporter permease [Paenibacillus sinensis]
MHFKSRADKWFNAFNYLLLSIVCLCMIFPLLYIFSVSFSTMQDFVQKDIILWPSKWDLGAYRYIFSTETFGRAMLVSACLTVVITCVNLLMTSTMAFATTFRFTGSKLILRMIVFTLLFSPGLIPSYLMVRNLGLINSYWSLILPGMISTFNLIVIRQFFQGLPKEIFEAANIDGANELQIFRRIALPLSKPALAAFALFYAVDAWNAYFNVILYMNDTTKWTIQVVLRQIVIVAPPDNNLLSSLLREPPPAQTVQMAAVLIATLPILIIYPFLQKHFAKGVMLGSVKG